MNEGAVLADAAKADPHLLINATRSLVDGLALIDSAEYVVFCNPRIEQLLQQNANELIGRRAEEWLNQVAAQATVPTTVRAQLQNALVSAEPDRAVEIEIRSSAGAERFLVLRFFAVCDVEESVLGTGIVVRDVTQERTTDAMKSQLLSTVSHELRTPLASIKGFATTLLRQDVRWDEATQRDFLRIIEEEADRLTEIIDNLLDMSQIEAGALRIAKEPVLLRKLIREVVDEMRMRTEAHYFVVDLPAGMPRVFVDPRRIRQVLTNLIGNAIKYSKKGQITVACEVEDEHVTVSVSDQGPGISPQYREKIFERFFQVDGASTRRVGGSGLGLSISRGIIEAHNGKLWVESAEGQGSTFRFTLPLAEPEPVE